MSFITRSLPLVTAFLALATNACTGNLARPVEAAPLNPVVCAGGTVHDSADAAEYSACDVVKGDLRISAPELEDLSALRRLRAVSGSLEVSGNPQLDDLSGLERLSYVGQLLVQGNAGLETLRGLESLRRAGKVVIENNGLYQATGISQLRQVGDLVIKNNPRLNSLIGFRALKHARSVEIRNNPRLCALGMLPALQSVEKQVTLRANRGLSRPDVQRLLGRIERGAEPPSREVSVPRREASL
jgi:hypothetical protein